MCPFFFSTYSKCLFLLNCRFAISAPLAGVAINKFNSRVVIIAGGLLSALGLATSAFAESVECVILTAGALTGKSVKS